MHFVVLVVVLSSCVLQQALMSFPPTTRLGTRLVGGATPCSGQVQLRHNDTWYSLCRTNWTMSEAGVVCRQLGCGAVISPFAHFNQPGISSSPVWEELLRCQTGDEFNLGNCSFYGNLTDSSCVDTYKAAIACYQPHGPNAPESMAVRLVSDTRPSSGRVEVYYNGEWGTVCSQGGWTLTEGQVVCRQLGYTDALAVSSHVYPYPPGNGTILLSSVSCHGNKELLGNCSHPGWYQHNCDHYNDVGVVCKVQSPDPSDIVRVRLASGTTAYSGRVEVNYNGEWGQVCADSWGLQDAQVVCRQLGLGPALSSASSYGDSSQTVVLLSDVDCSGRETALMDCSRRTAWYPMTRCTNDQYAGVECRVPDEVAVTVRLVSGVLKSEGSVQVYHNGEWGGVCGKSFTIMEADVVCRQLDYRRALTVKQPGDYGSVDLVILGNVRCGETDVNLEACQQLDWYPRHLDCLQSNAVISCDLQSQSVVDTEVGVRLTWSDNDHSGLVELFHNGQWGVVCSSGFNRQAAMVVCRQLGYASGEHVNRYSNRNLPILLDKITCRTGFEKNVAECGPLDWYRHDWNNCGPEQTAGVVCSGAEDEDYDVRIPVRLSNITNGRVELYHNGKWGGVCGAGVRGSEALVICRQLGFKYGRVVSPAGQYGVGAGAVISAWELTCSGEEYLVQDCTGVDWYNDTVHTCHVELTAGVECSHSSYAIKTGPSSLHPSSIIIVVLLAIVAMVLIITMIYCIFLRRSKRTAASAQMRYVVLQRQDNSTTTY